MLLPDIRQTETDRGKERVGERVSCTLRMSECQPTTAQLFLHSLFVWFFVFSGSSEPGGDEVTKRKREGLEGGCTPLSSSLASLARKHVLLFRIRGDTVAGAELFLPYLYYRLLAGAWLCLELWELCALLCKSKRQSGDKQDSLEHSETVCVSL